MVGKRLLELTEETLERLHSQGEPQSRLRESGNALLPPEVYTASLVAALISSYSPLSQIEVMERVLTTYRQEVCVSTQ